MIIKRTMVKIEVIKGDALEEMKKLSDKCIDLVLIDPPYFQVMKKDWKGEKHDWDNQWQDLSEYINWINEIALEVKRIMKINGSFYIFADDKICAYIQVELDKIFNLENSIIWVKPNNLTIKGWNLFRSYAPITEKILFYSNESRNTNLENPTYAENVKIFAPIVEYMIEQKRLIKEYFNFKTDLEFNNYVNKITDTKSVVSKHYFTYSQWVFPTKEIYKKLQTINNEVFKKEYEVFKKEYEVFKKEYEVFKKEYEDKRRNFNPKENFTDVWTFNIMGGKESCGKHPTQKPLKIIERIIETSSKGGDLVLDCFGGSGTTAVACKKLGRDCILVESKDEYIELTKKRLSETTLSLDNYSC